MEQYTSKDVPVIDVHGHYVSGTYRKVLEDTGRALEDSFPIPPWDVQMQLEVMDKLNIGASIFSISSPDICLSCTGDNGRSMSRLFNEEAAKYASDYPGKFGFFATVPMPDIDGTLKEIEYAFDVLHADGVKFYSNASGMYLGEPEMEPVFAELDRREAIFTLHPTKPSAVPAGCLKNVPIPPIEFQFDTTRAVANMIFNGVFERYRKIKFVCPHMATIIPLLAGRWVATAAVMEKFEHLKGFKAPDFMGIFKRFIYDCSGGFNLPVQIPALLSLSSPDTWIFGTDFPFTPLPLVERFTTAFRETNLLTEEQKIDALHNNATKLFPRFKKN